MSSSRKRNTCGGSTPPSTASALPWTARGRRPPALGHPGVVTERSPAVGPPVAGKVLPVPAPPADTHFCVNRNLQKDSKTFERLLWVKVLGWKQGGGIFPLYFLRGLNQLCTCDMEN